MQTSLNSFLQDLILSFPLARRVSTAQNETDSVFLTVYLITDYKDGHTYMYNVYFYIRFMVVYEKCVADVEFFNN